MIAGGCFYDTLYVAKLIQTVVHHGVFHTIIGITVMAAILGPGVGRLIKKVAER